MLHSLTQTNLSIMAWTILPWHIMIPQGYLYLLHNPTLQHSSRNIYLKKKDKNAVDRHAESVEQVNSRPGASTFFPFFLSFSGHQHHPSR